MEFITRKSACKKQTTDVLIKSPREITKNTPGFSAPKYCIIVKPFHTSFLPYKQIIFRGVTFSDDFSIELIRNNEAVIIENSHTHTMAEQESLFLSCNKAAFKISA